MAFQRGEIVLVNYPYTNMTALKARPAVVVSGTLYRKEQPDLMLAALTTNVSAATGTLDYLLQDCRLPGYVSPPPSNRFSPPWNLL